MVDRIRRQLNLEIPRSWDDADHIAWRRRMRRRQNRWAHLYPSIIAVVLAVLAIVVFIWHPY